MVLRKIYNFLNKSFWQTISDHPSIIKLKQESIKPFENLIPYFNDDEINQSFKKDNEKWFHHEFLYKISNGVLIEPSNKICIKGFRTLINESLPNEGACPSLFKYLVFRILFKRSLKINQAILFDHTAGLNYFHFFSDVISKLWLAEKFNLSKEIPVIIPVQLYNKPYFQFLLKSPELQSWNWKIQEKTDWFHINSLYILRAMPYDKNYWLKTLSLIKNCEPEPVKKIFLNRPQKDGRFLKNMIEVEPLLKKYNFEIIDTSCMTFEQQIITFSNAAVVIAIHGAGNTNIIFSNHKKVQFAEIMPANRMACQYYWLSSSLGISYDVILGSELNSEKSFYLLPEKLENLILKLQTPDSKL